MIKVIIGIILYFYWLYAITISIQTIENILFWGFWGLVIVIALKEFK